MFFKLVFFPFGQIVNSLLLLLLLINSPKLVVNSAKLSITPLTGKLKLNYFNIQEN
jgi:hypothetical protein